MLFKLYFLRIDPEMIAFVRVVESRKRLAENLAPDRAFNNCRDSIDISELHRLLSTDIFGGLKVVKLLVRWSHLADERASGLVWA